MASFNMANMNTLFKKGYLLAGVIMAANMFVVNEMKAMELSKKYQKATYKVGSEGSEEQTENQKKKIEVINKAREKNKKHRRRNKAREKYRRSETGLTIKNLENAINLIGGTVSSVANNYFKLWDYNPGWYRQFGCLGWKSKRFLYGVLQFEVNFNLGRGAFWAIPNIIKLIMIKTSKEGKKNGNFSWTLFFFSDILRGFTSMPLTFHISKFNFSISISLDSIIWWGIIDNILKLSGKKKMEEKKDENAEELMDMSEKKEKIDPKAEFIKEELKPEEKKEEPIIEEKKEEKLDEKKE